MAGYAAAATDAARRKASAAGGGGLHHLLEVGWPNLVGLLAALYVAAYLYYLWGHRHQ